MPYVVVALTDDEIWASRLPYICTVSRHLYQYCVVLVTYVGVYYFAEVFVGVVPNSFPIQTIV